MQPGANGDSAHLQYRCLILASCVDRSSSDLRAPSTNGGCDTARSAATVQPSMPLDAPSKALLLLRLLRLLRLLLLLLLLLLHKQLHSFAHVAAAAHLWHACCGAPTSTAGLCHERCRPQPAVP
jgi:hypothetical protein